MRKVKFVFILLLSFAVLISCDAANDRFVTFVMKDYMFVLQIQDTDPSDISFDKSILTEMDGVRTFKLKGNGKFTAKNHLVVINNQELRIDQKKPIDMKVNHSTSMVLRKNGEIVKGFLTTID